MARIGGVLALLVTHSNFSVSSGVGFLALFGVSVQPALSCSNISISFGRAATIEDSAVEGAVLRLRPIMMTMLVATLGLLPAATSHAIGSDSQRPFAIVIVGGLMVGLIMNIFLLPEPSMSAAQGIPTSCQNRRDHLRFNRISLKSWNVCAGLVACAGLICLLTANTAFGQAAAQGTIRVNLMDEAIQMALPALITTSLPLAPPFNRARLRKLRRTCALIPFFLGTGIIYLFFTQLLDVRLFARRH